MGTATVLEVTFSNEGNAPLTLQQSSISGSGFTSSGIGTGVNLDAGQSAVLSVTFNPSSIGKATGTVSFTSNFSDSTLTIPPSGFAISSGHSAALSWAPSTSTVSGYNIYGTSDLGLTWNRVNSLPTPLTSYTDWDAQGGLFYLFAITSVDASKNESLQSIQIPALIPLL